MRTSPHDNIASSLARASQKSAESGTKERGGTVTTRLFQAGPEDAGERLDRYLALRLREDGVSREKIKRAVKEGMVRVNGTAASSPKAQLFAGDVVEIGLIAPPSTLEPEHERLDIVYRDACLAVLNKPAGLVVHPAPGNMEGTLAHRLVAHFPELAALEGFRPGIVHRIDKDTSGLLLVALDEKTRLALAGLFAEHKIFKEYLALLQGVPADGRGMVEAPVGRHPHNRVKMAVVKGGKEAKSAWRVLHADPEGRFSLVAVRIFSGRTHQIRVHMSHMGHPLLGDALYGGPDLAVFLPAAKGNPPAGRRRPSRQMLHAWRLAFGHPCCKEEESGLLRFSCPPPEDFMSTVRALGVRMLRIVITGSPGCGKSSLLRALEACGIPAFSADAEVGALYEPGGAGRELLRARYGDRFVPDEKGPVDKLALGKAMRESDAFRREVERALHPMIQHAMERFWDEQEAAGAAMAMAEVPLYFECGFAEAYAGAAKSEVGGDGEGIVDGVPSEDAALAALLNAAPGRPLLLGVHCPFAIRRQRLLSKRGWSEEIISHMESWQWPEQSKMAACDIVAPNTGTEEELEALAPVLFERFRKLRVLRSVLLERHIKALADVPPEPEGP